MIRTLVLLVAVTTTAYGRPENKCDNEEVRTLVRFNNNFGNGLFQLLSKENGNIFFSPTSISSVLIAAYFGAKGKTAESLIGLAYLSIPYENITAVSPDLGYCLELLSTLKSSPDGYTLERANAVLSRSPVLDTYETTVNTLFGATVKQFDFADQSDKAVEEVNRWVKEKTHGKISKVTDHLDKSVGLLLSSAVYFKGTWETEFDPEDTKPRPFFNNGNDISKSVPTMTVTSRLPFLYDADAQFRALILPYSGNDISMVILLPFERDGIARLQEKITADTIVDILGAAEETEVRVYLPKGKLEYTKALKEVLTTAGLGAMFSVDADFSGITGNKDLHVWDVHHKSVIEVDEEGSEAAILNGGIALSKSRAAPYPRNVFNANHPFLFYIVDNRSGSSLFIGRLSEL